MKRIVYGTIALLLCCILTYAQDDAAQQAQKTADHGKKASDAFKEIVLEDFETTEYTDKNVHIGVSKDEKAGASIRTDYPAPIQDSKRYLGVKVFANNRTVVSIIPAKPLIIDNHCTYINAWVYGKNFSGVLSFMIKDANGSAKRLVLGKLNFLGWRKFSIPISDEISQEDNFLAQKRHIEITRIIYNPRISGSIPNWNYFYIDDITAIVREKYKDRQNNEW